MKIGILGNCQANAWKEAIRIISGHDDVWAVDLADQSEGDPLSRVGVLVSQCDFIFIVDSHKHLVQESEIFKLIQVEPVFIPSITFTGFHPDVLFARLGESTLTSGHGSAWLSRILLWSHINGIQEEQILSFYDGNLFEKLGYLDHFAVAIDSLRHQFLPFELNADSWLTSCRRLGIFMHGPNHPWAAAIGILANQMLRSVPGLSIKRTISSEEFLRYMNDYQSVSIWPVFPEIALRLGHEGSYLFKHQGSIQDLSEYVRNTREKWNNLGLTKEKIEVLPHFSLDFEIEMRAHLQ